MRILPCFASPLVQWFRFPARSPGRSSRGTVLLALALCAASSPLAAACAPAVAAPALASGERPVTGVPRYDQLFTDVHASWVAIREARNEEVDARGALARRLGLADAAAVDVIGSRLRERTARLAQDGLTLELEFTGIDDVDGLEPHADADAEAPAAGELPEATEEAAAPPTATLRTPGREPQRRELRLLEAVAQAALSGATVFVNMAHERRYTERLLAEAVELEAGIDASFADADERERVRAKLAEARSLLPQLNAGAREVSGSADILISLLDEAANTAPVAPARRRAPSPPKDGAARPASPPASAGPGAAPVSSAPPRSAPASVPAPSAPAAPGPQPAPKAAPVSASP